jgi:frataxin
MQPHSEALSLATYKQLAESALSALAGLLERMPFGGELDMDTSGLKYAVEGVGEYIFSKQPPSRQIWVSSPFTGSSKFSYDRREGWVDSKVHMPFMEYVEVEMGRIKNKLGRHREAVAGKGTQ